MPIRHHADLNRALTETEARLKALDAPAPDVHGDAADMQTARQNQEDIVLERGRLEDRRRFVLCALTKIERGTFGVCEECRMPIGAKRLAADPSVPRCLACQHLAEREAERFRSGTRPAAAEPDDEDGGAA